METKLTAVESSFEQADEEKEICELTIEQIGDGKEIRELAIRQTDEEKEIKEIARLLKIRNVDGALEELKQSGMTLENDELIRNVKDVVADFYNGRWDAFADEIAEAFKIANTQEIKDFAAKIPFRRPWNACEPGTFLRQE